MKSLRLFKSFLLLIFIIVMVGPIFGGWTNINGFAQYVGCIVEGTLVETADGPTRIENLVSKAIEGEASFVNSSTGILYTAPIITSVVNVATVSIHVGPFTVEVSELHPIVTKRGFISAYLLSSNDTILTQDGWMKIESIEFRQYTGNLFNIALSAEGSITTESDWYKTSSFGVAYETRYFYANGIAVGDRLVQENIIEAYVEAMRKGINLAMVD